MRASRLLVALGVILTGICAAWPFRQTLPVARTPTPIVAPHELPYRRPDTPLALAPASEASPASSAANIDTSPVSATALAVATERPIDLLTVAPPPAMPIAFEPIIEHLRPTSWKPSVAPLETPATKPRVYRLRDGDSLERLAERFLGDRARADEIYAANRHVLFRPDLLPVGIEIAIPPRQALGDLVPAKP